MRNGFHEMWAPCNARPSTKIHWHYIVGLYLPFKEEELELVGRVIDILSLRMYKSTSTYPKTLMELYKYVFDNLDPNDCGNILASWMLAVEKANTSILDQKDPWWPVKAGKRVQKHLLLFHIDWESPERTNVLFFILCGDHGQLVPFWNLYQALQSPAISSPARDVLTMAIILRRTQSWWLCQVPGTYHFYTQFQWHI